MKILILARGGVPFHNNSIEERPLGGTETAVINLARGLHERGHAVRVISTHPNPPVSLPLYLPAAGLRDLGPIDVLLVVRDWRDLFVPVKTKSRFYWTGDSYDQIAAIGVGDLRVQKYLDAFFAVSSWHAETFSKFSGVAPDKFFVLGNGIDSKLFAGEETRDSKRLIYTSTPYRGLKHLLQIFPRIKSIVPEASLHIFSGFNVYQGVEPDRVALAEWANLKEAFLKMPGVLVNENILQKDLAREFMRSAILAYPNTFEETSCITAMEAQAGGAVVVSSNKGALPETVGEAGILVEGKPGTDAYDFAFVRAVTDLLGDQSRLASLSQLGKKRARELFDWSNVIARFEEFSKEKFNIS